MRCRARFTSLTLRASNMGDTGHADSFANSTRLAADCGFSDLLRSAEQLSATVEGNEELPQVERNLRQILEASNELWSRVTQTTTQDNETQAYVLLSIIVLSIRRTSRRSPSPLHPVHMWLLPTIRNSNTNLERASRLFVRP